ncbi:cytochrome C biogenesis protein CcmB [Collibacillus ludicampi]|uniref:Cytochrome C biogenesis protein CcmB n=1 Tax=Collibacillus ludicampi TaxID=2771369 RepID=A0AAV4LB17_9BACL|nr:heme exporter protein CcmB [Collibacillus ludicampi]GIM44876.1 cytochrome C biogenesis protein CcmB [Collibacillus ludicampi]
MNAFYRSVFVMAAKDIRMEFRRKSLLLSLLVFAILLCVIMDISLDGKRQLDEGIVSGMLWTTLFFVSAVGLVRSDRFEMEHKGWYGLLLAPIDCGAIFYAKFVSNLLFAWLVDTMVVIVFFFLFDEPLPHSPILFIITMVLGSVGLISIGTFLAALGMSNPMADLLVPVMLFPLSVPLLIAVTQLTSMAMNGAGFENSTIWFVLIGGYDLIFLALPFLLFEFIVEV